MQFIFFLTILGLIALIFGIFAYAIFRLAIVCFPIGLGIYLVYKILDSADKALWKTLGEEVKDDADAEKGVTP